MISVATPDDLPEICELLRAMHAENGVGQVNDEKALGVITQRINDGGCMICRQHGRLVGSVAIYKDTWWYSDEKVFFDQWFFVHPEFRAFGHATRLLAALKQACRNTGVPLVLHVGTPIDALSKLKFFKKHLTPFGGSFVFYPDAGAKAA